MKAGNALSNNQINRVVYIIVDDVIDKKPNLDRKFFCAVATQMTSKFPNAFRDIVLKGKIARRLSSYGKLVYKLKNRYDNTRRKQERTRLQVEAPSIPEAYGCLQWQVINLPNDETEETLQEKQERLRAIYNEGLRNWNWGVIKELMSATYCLQRRLINSQFVKRRRRRGQQAQDLPPPSSTTDIQEGFPFLFTYKGMTLHFKTLTSVNFGEKVTELMNDLSEDLFDYFLKAEESNARIKAAMKEARKNCSCEDPELTGLILMLIRTLKDESSGLIQLIQVFISIYITTKK